MTEEQVKMMMDSIDMLIKIVDCFKAIFFS